MGDFLWSGNVSLPGGKPIPYKLTRGSWASEEIKEDGSVPSNHTLKAGIDTCVEHRVYHWKDLGAKSRSRITGKYRIHERVSSKFLQQPRRVIVWLPPSYDRSPSRRYPVLYMQDGQQVFDPATSTLNQDWEVDEWCTKLIAEDRLKELIVVGIYSSPDRLQEYDPTLEGEAYARFVAEELKPFIDEAYRTKADRSHTAVAGSSMGGCISLYLAWTRPDIFFGAACLSPSIHSETGPRLIPILEKTAAPPDLKIYLYCGGGDDLEKKLSAQTQTLKKFLVQKGFTLGENLVLVEDPGGVHNEGAWARHTDHWLLYLFGA
jgi:predicted alpha/beta superfamily hydrolase